MDIDKPEEKHISEFHYFERFYMNDLKDLLAYLNNEQSMYGRIIEMDAEETRDEYRIFIIRRIKFDNSKESFKVLNLCHKKVNHHLKINDCDFALLFDLSKKHKN